MRKSLILLTALILASCGKLGNIQFSNVTKATQIVLNVNYTLQPEKVQFVKNFNDQVYVWEFSYEKVNFVKSTSYIQRDIIPTNYTLSSETDYYSCFSIFYNYGGSNCALVE